MITESLEPISLLFLLLSTPPHNLQLLVSICLPLFHSLLLSFASSLFLFPFLYTNLPLPEMPRWRKECFETAEACVSPSAKRPAKSETPLYIQIYSTPHTSHHTLSAPLTKLYIYRAVDGRWALFSWCVYLTYGKGRETGGSWGGWGASWSAMWPPSDSQR